MKRPVLRLAVRIASVVLLLAAMVVALGPLRSEMQARFDRVRAQAVARLEAVLGREISYDSISPSILRYLSVNDLIIHGTASEPADLLRVGRVRIYYRPLRLIQSRYGEAFSEIRIENTSIAVDTRLDSDLNALLADVLGARESAAREAARSADAGGATEEAVDGGSQTLAGILPDDLVVSGRNIDLSLRSELGLLEADRLFFTTTLADDIVDVRWQGEMRLSETIDTFPVDELTGRIEASGTINVATGQTLLEVFLPVLESDIAVVRGQVVQVRLADGVLEARNVQNRDPIDLYARYDNGSGELYARILADGYRVSDLVRLEGEYAALNEYLALPVRGQASATLTPRSLSFGGSLSTQLVGIARVPDGEVTLQFDGDTSGVTIDNLRYTTAVGSASYRGTIGLDPLRPDGVLTVSDLTYGGIDPLTMTATLASGPGSISFQTGRFAYGGTRFDGVGGTVSLGASPTTSFTVEIDADRESRLEVGTVHTDDGALRTARVDARGVEPSRLVDIQQAILPDLAVADISFLPASMVVDTRIELDLTDGLVANVPLFYAYDADRPDDYLSFALDYDDGAVDLRNLTARYQGYEGSGDFTAQIGPGGGIDFTSDIVVEGIPYAFSGRLEPDNSLRISGLYDVDARFFFGERDELVFRASGNVPVPVPGGDDAMLAFRGNGFFFSIDDWAVNVDRLDATGIPYGPVDAARVGLRGSFTPSGARLASVAYEDEFSSLAGSGSVSWDIERLSGSLELSLAQVIGDGESQADVPGDGATGAPTGAGSDGSSGDDASRPDPDRESYSLSASYVDGVLEASATVERTPLLRLGVETLRGAVSGSVSLAGPLDGLSATVDGRLVNGKFNNDPVEVDARVEAGPRAIRIVDASARYVRTRAQNVNGELSLTDGSLRLSGVLTQNSERGALEVGIDATGRFESVAAVGDVATSDFSGTLLLSGLPVQEDLPSEWEFDVSRRGLMTSAVGGPLDTISIAFAEDGSFEASIGEPLPFRFDAVGLVEGGSIEADLINVWGDGARLWSIIAQPGFAFTGGTLGGSVRIVGPVNDPDFYGTLVAQDVTAELSIMPDQLGPGRSFIVFDEKLFSVREASVPVGDARASVRMEAVLDRWIPQEYRITIETDARSPVRVVNDFGGVAVDGRAVGTIVVSGAPSVTQISGDITASSTTITLSEAADEPPPDDEAGDLGVDLTVRAGRGVQFLWPTNTFPILRGFADVGESIRITFSSAGGTYSVTGGVEIQGGEVFYFDRSFYIREGRIAFDEDEQEFDPLLSVNAEIREVADEGPVRIYLVADERPLSEFTPQWRSDPAMSEASIIALLGGSVFVSDSGDPIGLSDAVLLTSDVVSQFGIIRGFESTVREALQLDLFSIRTQLFQNLLRGVIEPDDEYPLDNTVPSLGQYLDNTTLFMGKYLGTDLFLELLVQLRAAETSALEPQSLAGIEVDSELGLEWQTPFFLLEWSFFPRDPSSLFLADNTISFSWEYSY